MNPKVELHIANHGKVILELDQKNAPNTVANFLDYVDNGHYDSCIFHRVIPGFMVQGGGFSADMKEKPAAKTVENEAHNGLKNNQYTIAMARTSDPHSAGAQFFINVADNDFLNHRTPDPQGWGYAVFGKVIEGTEIVNKIEAVPTGRSGFHDDVPKEAVLIEKAVRV